VKYGFLLACCLLVWTAGPGWSAPAPPPPNATVSLDLKQTPLHQALDLLFDQLKLQYSIAADVPDAPITLKVRDMPFPEALRAILRLGRVSAGPPGHIPDVVTYRKEGDLYQIGMRPPDLSEMPGGGFGGFGGGGLGGGPAGPGGLGGAPPSPPVVEKIPVNYLQPDEAAGYLSRQGVQNISSIQALTHDNALLVRGDPDSIQELKRLLQLADVPSRPITLSAGISGPGINGAPIAIRSSARSLVGDTVFLAEQAATAGQPAHMKVSLRTQLLGDGNLQVWNDWDVSVPIAGGAKGPIRLVKRLTTTTQIRPGEQVPVAEVDLAGWGGKGVLRLWIRGQWSNAGIGSGGLVSRRPH
jgi:hypothetical protein